MLNSGRVPRGPCVSATTAREGTEGASATPLGTCTAPFGTSPAPLGTCPALTGGAMGAALEVEAVCDWARRRIAAGVWAATVAS